jgi:hypothetical protein
MIIKLDEIFNINLIISFQFYIKGFTHVISQKNMNKVFHSDKKVCENIKFVEKSHSFES